MAVGYRQHPALQVVKINRQIFQRTVLSNLAVASTAKAILDVNLTGAAKVIDVFSAYAEEGTSIGCTASMGDYMADVSKDLKYHLATVETGRLLDHPDLDPSALNSGTAYAIAKRANHLRVQASARLWTSKGARLNSISPGVISTVAGNAEIEAEPEVKRLIELSAMGRPGLPTEVAKVVTFPTRPQASFDTGSDILVDGGAVSGLRWNNVR
jgi:NAD(P)-dependent dehydrogenase (short-subunit alcohol dehydrogenase family)